MKKVFLMTALAGMAALGAAQAQSWTVDGPFKDEFVGCSRLSTGQVQCIMKSTYVGSTPMYYGATFLARDSAAYAPDQKRFIAINSSANGRDVTNAASLNIPRATPVVVAYTFNYPAQFDQIKLLFLDTGMLKEVPIKTDGSASTPAASNTAARPATAPTKPPTDKPATDKPTTDKPASSNSSSSTLNLAAIDIKLTDCKPNNQGGYVCSKAEVNPRH